MLFLLCLTQPTVFLPIAVVMYTDITAHLLLNKNFVGELTAHLQRIVYFNVCIANVIK